MAVKKEKKNKALFNLAHHKFHPKDLLQVMIGASILAIPVGFTEEAWRLGENLPWLNIIGLMTLSVLFISAFTYYNYHRHHKLGKHWREFVKRVLSTYAFSFLVVSILLTLIERAPWSTDILIAVKRVIIVTFPASMSAAIADVVK